MCNQIFVTFSVFSTFLGAKSSHFNPHDLELQADFTTSSVDLLG